VAFIGDPGATRPGTMRESILAEATQLFADTGFEGTSLNDIAAGVGIKRPSLLHHFASKDELYGEVFENMLSDWLERVESVITAPGEGWEKFAEVITVGFDVFAENPAYVRLMRREALDGGGRLGIDLVGVVEPLFTAAVAWMEDQMESGHFRRTDARQVVVSAYAVLLGYVSDAPFLNGLFGGNALEANVLAERRTHLLDLFHRTLVADPA
jgi:AcrR family transcriptional regulator